MSGDTTLSFPQCWELILGLFFLISFYGTLKSQFAFTTLGIFDCSGEPPKTNSNLMAQCYFPEKKTKDHQECPIFFFFWKLNLFSPPPFLKTFSSGVILYLFSFFSFSPFRPHFGACQAAPGFPNKKEENKRRAFLMSERRFISFESSR